MRFLLLLQALLALLVPALALAGEVATTPDMNKRLMICIGAEDYVDDDLDLKYPKQDAEKVCAAGEAVGFETILLTEEEDDPKRKLTKDGLLEALSDLETRLSEQAYGIVFFYFSGHGIQVDGANYFVPVDKSTDNFLKGQRPAVASLHTHLLPIAHVTDVLNKAKRQIPIQLFSFDMCRNDPFAAWFAGDLDKDLAPPANSWSPLPEGSRPKPIPQVPTGRVQHFATQPGQTAMDNGFYADCLAERLLEPNVNLSDLFLQVGDCVRAKTSAQSPYYINGLSSGQLTLITERPTVRPTRATNPLAMFATRKLEAYEVQGYKLQPVQPGRFQMGCTEGQQGVCLSDESPVTTVTIQHPFWMGTTEFTRGAWAASLGLPPPARPDLPLVNVNFCDVVLFANHLSQQEGLPWAYSGVPAGATIGGRCDWAGQVVWERESDGYRLPTEAEWEYTARAGTDLRYAGSDRSGPVAGDGLGVKTVGRKMPNAWGFFDMSGNVWEWVFDTYRVALPGGEVVDPYGTSGVRRVGRGGSSWFTGGSRRVSDRYWFSPVNSWNYLGFRLARGVPGPGSAR